MKKYLILFREPDGREIGHSEAETKLHRENWRNWLYTWGQSGNLAGGSALTLNGRIIKQDGSTVINDIYKNGTEIVGGFLLLNATDLEEVVKIMKTCPIYEFDGYTEIRELQDQG